MMSEKKNKSNVPSYISQYLFYKSHYDIYNTDIANYKIYKNIEELTKISYNAKVFESTVRMFADNISSYVRRQIKIVSAIFIRHILDKLTNMCLKKPRHPMDYVISKFKLQVYYYTNMITFIQKSARLFIYEFIDCMDWNNIFVTGQLLKIVILDFLNKDSPYNILHINNNTNAYYDKFMANYSSSFESLIRYVESKVDWENIQYDNAIETLLRIAIYDLYRYKAYKHTKQIMKQC